MTSTSSSSRPSSAGNMATTPLSVPDVVENLSLDSYVPWGVITIETSKVYPDNGNWTEINEWDDSTSTVPAGFHDKFGFKGRKLLAARWIRIFRGRHRTDSTKTCWRVYILAEDMARRDVPRDNLRLRQLLSWLLSQPYDASLHAWNGYEPVTLAGSTTMSLSSPSLTIRPHSISNDSLFYIFNTLASPVPDTERIRDEWAAAAAVDMLEGLEGDYGVETQMYPYQRRSVAAMIQRETAPKSSADPRLEQRTSPTGQVYFFDKITTQLFKTAPFYEEVRGGILAETMGYGKTLIALALISSLKGSMPKAPVEHIETRPFVNKTGTRSLMSTAAHVAVHNGVPWRQFFAQQAGVRGLHWEQCVSMLETPPYYEIIDDSDNQRYESRQTRRVQKILLVKTTLIIVPPNLFHQWQAEIAKHLKHGELSGLMANASSGSLARAEELAKYDFILIDKKKFLQEHGLGSTNDRFRNIHFLRVIIDEGHAFAATGGSNDFLRQIKSLRAERRWIVSGTPTSGTVGVEVDLAANVKAEGGTLDDDAELQAQTLERRKQQRAEDSTDLSRLGRIVTELLQAQPWCNSNSSGDAAGWNRYTAQRDGDIGFYSAYAVRSILESIVVRHRIEDVEAELPPLHNTPVFVTPTTYDKATMDLFTFTLAANALTSERVDQDYLFHAANRKYLDEVVSNLRRAPFFWSGFKPLELTKTLEVTIDYAEKHGSGINADDAKVLAQALAIVPKIVDDKVFQALANAQEIGLCVMGLPQAIGVPLGIDENSIAIAHRFRELNFARESHSTTTASRLLAAQKFCKDSGSRFDPLRELSTVVDKIANTSEHSDQVLSDGKAGSSPAKRLRGVPQFGDTQLSDKQFAKHATLGRITVQKNKKRNLSEINRETNLPVVPASGIRISGTVSAKLSYLLSRVLELNKTEKILIFYEGDHIAWYIAQGLEAIDVPHFIYANKMPQKLRNKYLETFAREDCAERVMLIDIKQGSHGLNITEASRIFFVNPVWQVGTEAQAIKRAHRIGQTKPVFVETLILQDSVEHRIFERRRRMTRDEQAHAKPNPLDDNEVHEMLKKFKFYGGYDNIADNERYAPVNPMPLVFPELAASQAREGITTSTADVGAEASTSGQNITREHRAAGEEVRPNGKEKENHEVFEIHHMPVLNTRPVARASNDDATAAAVAMMGVSPVTSFNGDTFQIGAHANRMEEEPRPAKKVKKTVGFSE